MDSAPLSPFHLEYAEWWRYQAVLGVVVAGRGMRLGTFTADCRWCKCITVPYSRHAAIPCPVLDTTTPPAEIVVLRGIRCLHYEFFDALSVGRGLRLLSWILHRCACHKDIDGWTDMVYLPERKLSRNRWNWMLLVRTVLIVPAGWPKQRVLGTSARSDRLISVILLVPPKRIWSINESTDCSCFG